jgi:hypothetical protein
MWGVGVYRSKPYVKHSARLANCVHACWACPPDVTIDLAKPLVDLAERYLPEKAKRAIDQGMTPARAILACHTILSGCVDREKAVVAAFLTPKRHEQPVEPEPDQTAPAVDPGALAGEALNLDAVGVEA